MVERVGKWRRHGAIFFDNDIDEAEWPSARRFCRVTVRFMDTTPEKAKHLAEYARGTGG